MSISYGWFVGSVLPWDRVLELVRSVPNEGLTEIHEGVPVDVYLSKKKVVVEPADAMDQLLHVEKYGGSFSYDLGSHLELAQCIAIEGLGRKDVMFDGYRCTDLERLLSRVKIAREDLPKQAKSIEALTGSLAMALEWHVAVVFGQ